MIFVEIREINAPDCKAHILELCYELEGSVFNLFQKIGLAIGAMDFDIPGLLIHIGLVAPEIELFP
jgi:hypothetical protein